MYLNLFGEKEMNEMILPENLEIPLENYPYMGSWHGQNSIQLNGYKLNIAGTITGCGLMQAHGITFLNYDINKNITKEEFLKKFESQKKSGCGAIICTLGDSHKLNEERLFELGFQLISEYSNYRHNSEGQYKQRLYILKL